MHRNEARGLEGGFEISGYAHVAHDWIEIYKERVESDAPRPAAFAHVSISKIVGFELIEV